MFGICCSLALEASMIGVAVFSGRYNWILMIPTFLTDFRAGGRFFDFDDFVLLNDIVLLSRDIASSRRCFKQLNIGCSLSMCLWITAIALSLLHLCNLLRPL